MRSLLSRLVLIVLSAFFATFTFAQDFNKGEKAEMADAMRSNGKIYVVVVVVLIILLGLIGYVINLDRKISRLEKEKSEVSV